jgi:hypothetical protein
VAVAGVYLQPDIDIAGQHFVQTDGRFGRFDQQAQIDGLGQLVDGVFLTQVDGEGNGDVGPARRREGQGHVDGRDGN